MLIIARYFIYSSTNYTPSSLALYIAIIVSEPVKSDLHAPENQKKHIFLKYYCILNTPMIVYLSEAVKTIYFYIFYWFFFFSGKLIPLDYLLDNLYYATSYD